MTSQEIERAGFTTDPKKYHPDRATTAWLKEIAYQLAVRNEQEGSLDQQLKSAGKVLDGMAKARAESPRNPDIDFPLDQAMRLVDKIRNQRPDIEDSELRDQLGDLQVLLIRVRKLTSEHMPIRRLEDIAQNPQWAPDGPMKKE